MAKYVLIYKGGGMPEGEEAQQEAMARWGAWFGALGDSVVEPGNPFGASSSVGPGGVSGLTGYSVISAGSLDDALAKADGCPILVGGNGSVEVYEALEM